MDTMPLADIGRYKEDMIVSAGRKKDPGKGTHGKVFLWYPLLPFYFYFNINFFLFTLIHFIYFILFNFFVF